MPAFDGDVLRARGLVKQYKRIRAVDGIDLTVGAGERVALLGPNGAGKTTTLLMLLGVVTPDAGWVEITGFRLPRHRSAAAGRVGFAAGYLPLPERLRVREFLCLFGKLYGLHDPTPQVEAGLERFAITHLGDALKVRTGLNRLCAEDGAALLVTSHNMVEVERLCDRVVFISQGKIVADGRPGDVAARFGRDDLEGVFLHLAEELEERVPEQRRRRGA